MKIVPVILSGGSGTRLWPVSGPDKPKQFLPLTSPHSMLRLTADRVADADLFGPIVVVAGAGHAAEIEHQLRDHDVSRIILEPAARNTAPAIALAAAAAAPDDILMVLPSDHVILDIEAFRKAAARAAALAADGWIVTFGMKAERPETGYGYIKRGAPLGDGAFEVERFVEKPDAETARLYCADGGYDWNGGIFCFRADTMLEALSAHARGIRTAVLKSLEEARSAGGRLYPDPIPFECCPSLSIDYAVMEKAQRIAVVPVSLGWSDVGSWEALYEVSDKDAAGCAQGDNVLAIDASNCLLRSDGPLIAAIGVENIAVIASGGSVLVVPLAQSQRVKEVVDRIAQPQRPPAASTA